LINALGQWLLPGRWGIFILQSISLSITLFILYFTAKVFCRPKSAFLSVVISLFLLAGCYQGGNHVEEYMLPFLALGFLLAVKFFVEQTDKKTGIWWYSLIWGLCFGMVFMLRPNDAVAFFLGIMIGLFAWLLYHKKWQAVLINGSLFFTGALFAVVPIVIGYICMGGGLNDLWFGMIEVNSKVSGGFQGQFFTLFKWGKWAILLLMLTLCVMVGNTNYNHLFWFVIPVCSLQLLFVGEKMYAHYLIPFFPLIMLFIVMLFCQNNRSVIMLAIAILCLSHRPLPRSAVLNIISSIKHMPFESHQPEVSTRCPIPEDEKSSVWNHSADPWRKGVPMAWLVNNGIVQCNRKIDSSNDYVEEIDFDEADPLWVISYGNEFEKASSSLDYSLNAVVTTTYYTLNLYKKN
jgi:hypothetical protein